LYSLDKTKVQIITIGKVGVNQYLTCWKCKNEIIFTSCLLYVSVNI